MFKVIITMDSTDVMPGTNFGVKYKTVKRFPVFKSIENSDEDKTNFEISAASCSSYESLWHPDLGNIRHVTSAGGKTVRFRNHQMPFSVNPRKHGLSLEGLLHPDEMNSSMKKQRTNKIVPAKPRISKKYSNSFIAQMKSKHRLVYGDNNANKQHPSHTKGLPSVDLSSTLPSVDPSMYPPESLHVPSNFLHQNGSRLSTTNSTRNQNNITILGGKKWQSHNVAINGSFNLEVQQEKCSNSYQLETADNSSSYTYNSRHHSVDDDQNSCEIFHPFQSCCNFQQNSELMLAVDGSIYNEDQSDSFLPINSSNQQEDMFEQVKQPIPEISRFENNLYLPNQKFIPHSAYIASEAQPSQWQPLIGQKFQDTRNWSTRSQYENQQLELLDVNKLEESFLSNRNPNVRHQCQDMRTDMTSNTTQATSYSSHQQSANTEFKFKPKIAKEVENFGLNHMPSQINELLFDGAQFRSVTSCMMTQHTMISSQENGETGTQQIDKTKYNLHCVEQSWTAGPDSLQASTVDNEMELNAKHWRLAHKVAEILRHTSVAMPNLLPSMNSHFQNQSRNTATDELLRLYSQCR